MLRLLVFLSLIIWTHGQDGGFGTFCKSELGGQLVADECHQSYNLPNLPENSAEALCSYRSPYAVKNAKADSNGLSCIFNKPGDCGNAHYIHGFCYKLAASCTGEWALFSLSDKWTFRWLVLHFSAIKKAIVALPKKHKAENSLPDSRPRRPRGYEQGEDPFPYQTSGTGNCGCRSLEEGLAQSILLRSGTIRHGLREGKNRRCAYF